MSLKTVNPLSGTKMDPMVDMICYRLKCIVHTLSIFPFLCLLHFILLLSSEAFQLGSGLFYLPQLSL